MKTYAIKNEATGFIDNAWTLEGLVTELAGVIRDEETSALTDEDLYARHFDMAVLEALRDFQAISDKLIDAGLTQLIEDVRAEKKIPIGPDEDELVRLRLLLARIRAHAEWVPAPHSAQHVLNDLLVIGRIERFDDKGATYGTTLMGDRTGAMEFDEKARELVLEEAVSGRLTDRDQRMRQRLADEDSGKLGEFLELSIDKIVDLKNSFIAMKALGIKWTSSSPIGDGKEKWLIRGATSLPEKLPEWLTKTARPE